ncbi:MAG: hypothetical protein R2770_01010 [Acidimicrobiales bacterium]
MGADVSTPVDGDSPLLAAAAAGAWEIVDLLLEAGADPMALSSPTSLLDFAVTADSESALGAVLEALEPGDLDGGIGTRAMAGLLGADGLDGRESRVDALIDAGVKPDVWNLLTAAEVVATDALFERVYAAVEAGLANGDSSFDWGVVCSFDLNADDISLAYRVDDLERIVSLAVRLDKC